MTPPPSSLSPPQSWERLLRTPHPRDHVVQLYTDDHFLGRAVAHFLGGGLRYGDGAVITTSTRPSSSSSCGTKCWPIRASRYSAPTASTRSTFTQIAASYIRSVAVIPTWFQWTTTNGSIGPSSVPSATRSARTPRSSDVSSRPAILLPRRCPRRKPPSSRFA